MNLGPCGGLVVCACSLMCAPASWSWGMIWGPEGACSASGCHRQKPLRTAPCTFTNSSPQHMLCSETPNSSNSTSWPTHRLRPQLGSADGAGGAGRKLCSRWEPRARLRAAHRQPCWGPQHSSRCSRLRPDGCKLSIFSGSGGHPRPLTGARPVCHTTWPLSRCVSWQGMRGDVVMM